MNKHKSVARISVGLDSIEFSNLEKALKVVHAFKLKYAEEVSALDRSNLIRRAVQALCTAIVRDGCMPLPLAVDLRQETDLETCARMASYGYDNGDEIRRMRGDFNPRITIRTIARN